MITYQSQARGAWSRQFNADDISIGEFRAAVTDIANTGKNADGYKRRLFYKNNSTAYRPDISLSDVLKTQRNRDIAHGIIGTATESGKLAESLEMILACPGQDIDVVSIREKIGGVLFYLANLATDCGITLEDAMAANIEKIRKSPDIS